AVDPAARGLVQSAYQILVASSQERLGQDQGDLWDSGIVESSQSVLVAYQGKPLPSQARCFWKVRVRGQDGAFSAWSEPAFWTMGLLAPSDWHAQWIGSDQVHQAVDGSNTLPDPWFRKEFELESVPQQALIYVASVGYHEVYVNGKKITEDILAPSVSNLRSRARYVTYDIASALQPGINVIGLWLGVSWSIYPEYKTEDKPQTPLVIAQAHLTFAEGKSLQIGTDATWKTQPSPNTTIGVWNFMNFGGEVYDANQEIKNWCEPGLDDSAWKSATVYKPNLTLSAEMVEPNRIIHTVRPLGIKKVGEKEYRIDLGQNFSGWFRMVVKGLPGQRIDFQFSERDNQAMTHRHRSAYIIGPAGQGVFQNHFNYFSGRWVQVKGLDYAPALNDIEAYVIRTNYERAGEFRCDSDLLNRIYDTTLWTLDSLTLGGYIVDCPQRERMGYGGDAHATTECGLTNYSLGAFFTKWSEDWRDTQDSTGNLPYTAPTFWGGGGPGWSGYCITLPWDLYRRYNDTRILETNFNSIQRWLAFLETKAKDDLLVRWGGEWDFLGDWLWPHARGVNGDTPETLFFNNTYWIYNLQTAARIARVLGKEDQAQAWDARADAVRKAVHAKFYNVEDHSYANAFQAYLAIALFTDLPPEDLRDEVWKRLENEILVVRNGHIHAGITGGAFLFKTLLAHNRQDLLYSMVSKDTYPSWGEMLSRGATTMWEDWEGRPEHSLLHSSYLYVGTWFIEGLGGIKLHPDSAGFQNFLIQPGLFGENPVKKVESSYDSLYGLIRSDWTVENNQFTLNAVVPPNTTATIVIPVKAADAIQESGKALAIGAGITAIESKDGFVRIQVNSGRYQFTTSL
ncbi:MAG: family 78 glycoside hydrolase catalytic domain, partial [bacterium]|nr:family 78 glycoside hydrolase catalytic domain [bacterium]